MDGVAKMRYLIRVNDEAFEARIESDGKIALDDQLFAVDMQAIGEQSFFSLLIDHESYELVAEKNEDGFRVLLWGEMYQVVVEGDLTRQKAAKKSRHEALPAGECVICAPLSGLVVQVPVVVGQEVSAGEVLIVLESMKMENELLAPRQGVVKAIHVATGDTPRLDDRLVILE